MVNYLFYYLVFLTIIFTNITTIDFHVQLFWYFTVLVGVSPAKWANNNNNAQFIIILLTLISNICF